jgi:hypothetical protein
LGGWGRRGFVAGPGVRLGVGERGGGRGDVHTAGEAGVGHPEAVVLTGGDRCGRLTAHPTEETRQHRADDGGGEQCGGAATGGAAETTATGKRPGGRAGRCSVVSADRRRVRILALIRRGTATALCGLTALRDCPGAVPVPAAAAVHGPLGLEGGVERGIEAVLGPRGAHELTETGQRTPSDRGSHGAVGRAGIRRPRGRRALQSGPATSTEMPSVSFADANHAPDPVQSPTHVSRPTAVRNDTQR